MKKSVAWKRVLFVIRPYALKRESERDGRCGALFGLMTPAESRSESRTGGDALLLFRETLCGGLSTWFSQSFSYLCGWKKNTLFQVQYRVYLLLFETTAPQQAHRSVFFLLLSFRSVFAGNNRTGHEKSQSKARERNPKPIRVRVLIGAILQ